MTEYKPGTVARLKTWGKDATAVRYTRGWAYVPDMSGTGAGTVGYSDDDCGGFTDIRPLAVLDPADEVVETFVREHTNGTPGNPTCVHSRPIARQIEAQTEPPRIPEPGLWGVVEAHTVGNPERRRFGRTKTDTWVPEQTATGYGWDELIDPTLIREGVQA